MGQRTRTIPGMLFGTINALTLCTRSMPRSCEFYTKLGLLATFGGPHSEFTTFSASSVSRSNGAQICRSADPMFACSGSQ